MNAFYKDVKHHVHQNLTLSAGSSLSRNREKFAARVCYNLLWTGSFLGGAAEMLFLSPLATRGEKEPALAQVVQTP